MRAIYRQATLKHSVTEICGWAAGYLGYLQPAPYSRKYVYPALCSLTNLYNIPLSRPRDLPSVGIGVYWKNNGVLA